MVNVNAPFGLRPAYTKMAGGYNGATTRYYVPATDSAAIGIGDPVKLAGSADADGVPTVTRVTTPGTDVWVGVVVGVEPLPEDLNVNYRKASTAMYVLVADDASTVFHVMEQYTGTALAATDVGLNTNIILGTVDTTTGNGKTVLSNAAEATTNTLDVQLLRLAPIPGNTYGIGAIWEVKMNKHQFANATTGV